MMTPAERRDTVTKLRSAHMTGLDRDECFKRMEFADDQLLAMLSMVECLKTAIYAARAPIQASLKAIDGREGRLAPTLNESLKMALNLQFVTKDTQNTVVDVLRIVHEVRENVQRYV